MKSLVFAACIAASFAVSADMVAKNGDDTVVLMDKPCPYGSVLRYIDEKHRDRFKKADTRVSGQRYFACWVEVDGLVMLVYEDGDQGMVPLAMFKDSPGV